MNFNKSFFLLILLFLSSCNQVKRHHQWKLIWSDEFESGFIDLKKWSFLKGCDGGGNGERSCYTDSKENAYVKNGKLHIVGRRTNDEKSKLPYTSAKLSTKNKRNFKYGRFEIRAKLPAGQGTWSSFWLMPSNSIYGSWPLSGEIDILETRNLKVPTSPTNPYPEKLVHSRMHFGKYSPNNTFIGHEYSPFTNPADDFHTYSIEWEEFEVRWYFDGFLYSTQNNLGTLSKDCDSKNYIGWFLRKKNSNGSNFDLTCHSGAPFDQEFYLILHLAIGGFFPEPFNLKGIDPSLFGEDNPEILVDYVRYYQCNNENGKGCKSPSNGGNMSFLSKLRYMYSHYIKHKELPDNWLDYSTISKNTMYPERNMN